MRENMPYWAEVRGLLICYDVVPSDDHSLDNPLWSGFLLRLAHDTVPAGLRVRLRVRLRGGSPSKVASRIVTPGGAFYGKSDALNGSPMSNPTTR